MRNLPRHLGILAASATLLAQLAACSDDSTNATDRAYSFSVTSANCDAVAIAASQFDGGDASQGAEVVRLLKLIAPDATADLVQRYSNSETGGADYQAAATQAAERYNARWTNQCDSSLDVASFATGEAKPAPTPPPTDVDVVIAVEDGFTFDEAEYRVAAGKLRVALQNNSSIAHDFTISGPDGDLVRADLLNGNGEYVVEQLDLPAGVYTVTCAVPGHASESATLVVG